LLEGLLGKGLARRDFDEFDRPARAKPHVPNGRAEEGIQLEEIFAIDMDDADRRQDRVVVVGAEIE